MMGLLNTGCQAKPQSVIGLADLPYPLDALEPYISSKTLSFHYNHHHKNYVDTANRLIQGTPYRNMPLVEIIKKVSKDQKAEDLFNQAAQAFNHEFYWKSMGPDGGGASTGPMEALISDSFGSYRQFDFEFSEAASALFGSGWVWLVQDSSALRITATANAHTPIADGKRPVLCIDLWEHAYYLDYQYRRDDYIRAFLDHLINREFAQSNIRSA